MPQDDDLLTLYALRAHLLAMPPVAQTTGVDLGSSASGYTRTDLGSFVTDGFMVGMEVVPSGFTDTTPGIVAAVEANALVIVGGRNAEAAASGRTLSVGVPPLFAMEGTIFPPEEDGETVDITNRWHVDEDYLPGPERQVTAGGPGAQIEHGPECVFKVYSPAGYGVDAPYRVAGAVKDRFPPHTALLRSDGNVVRVRGDVAPYRGQMTTRNGEALIVVTVPLQVRTVNSI